MAQSLFLAMVSNYGILKVYDSRNWSAPYINTQLEVKPTQSSVQLKFKPTNEQFVSVCGFDENVYVYKLEPEPSVVFVHDGHQHISGTTAGAPSSSHVWIPTVDNLVISSALNGSVQAWQFEEKSATS